MEFSRESPEYARVVIGKLLPDAKQRRSVLEFLAKLIQLAGNKPEKWGVTLHASELALNIGGGYYAFWLTRSKLHLYWLQNEEPDLPDSVPHFKNLPGARKVTASVSELLPILDSLLPRVELLIEKANETSKTPLIPAAQRAHSPGVLQYLEKELGIKLPTPEYPELPQGFTWIPFFAELAERAMGFRDRQEDLIAFLKALQDDGAMIGALTDKDEAGNTIPLTVQDPFTFFSHFCRGIRGANRNRIFSALKAHWNINAPLPTDMDGVPLVNNQKAWFFPYSYLRHEHDLAALWNIAEAALTGWEGVTEEHWNLALEVKQVALAKLTMGLFWLNPETFLPLDRNIRSYLARKGIAVLDNLTVEQYRALCAEVQARLKKTLPEVSKEAFLTAPPPRYWVGGHQWEEKSMLPEFLAESAWWHGFGSPDWSTQARVTFGRFEEIEIGDYFAIKGYGGQNTLKIHFVGRVTDKDENQKKVTLERLEVSPSPLSINPAKGTGSWFGTLREITDPAIIAWMFHGKPYTSGNPPTLKPTEDDVLPDFDLNTILYGPPGTGKTYETAKRAVEIIDGTASTDRATLMARYRELQQAGRIAFVTFHQSYSYEDFVEGIRPVMDDSGGDSSPRYQVVDGILKELALEAVEALVKPKAVPAGVVPFSALWAELIDRIDKDPGYKIQGLGTSEYELTETAQGNLTGTNVKGEAKQPYNASRRKVEQVWAALPPTQKPNHNTIMGILKVGSHTNLIGAVIEELRKIALQMGPVAPTPPIAPTRNDVLAVLERSTTAAFEWNGTPEQAPRFVLIVDEINRGNISKILGELITLLEDDKRLDEENELTVTLPYSRETFGLPANLYLIGTMNTADKSLALLDVALRRRFAFEELPPRFEVCELDGAMQAVLEELNRRITLRKDRDHRIGHAFFMNVGESKDAFDKAFARKVIPLLQEYFYNDWEGLRYVLGEQNGLPRFILPLNGGQESGARNRWQWHFDASQILSPLETLKANYALPATA